MSTITPHRWREISPYLDQVLALPQEERGEWLAAFAHEHPDLAELLEKLLQDHQRLSAEKFLESSPETPAPETSLAGQSIGPYKLLSAIAQGGMGSVWLAERNDGRFDRKVAVKFLHFSVAAHGGVERFKREGRIVAQLAHPHIAELLDAGVTAGGEPYLVLEYIDGEPITEYCDRRHLPVEARIRLFLDVLSAVAHAHASLIVHRDIKPSNVLVRTDGEVKLLDFGIAKLLDDDTGAAERTSLTLQAGGALTPQYAAPEQITGAPITTATDVYSLGVLLYLLLTGQHPAGAETKSAADLIKAITETEPRRASAMTATSGSDSAAEKRATSTDKLSRQLRGDLDTIVGKALKKNPADRYNSANVFADDLQRYLGHEPISARPDSFTYHASRFIRRNRLALGLITLAVLAVIAGATTTLIQARTARRQRDAALRERDRAARVTQLLTSMFKVSDPSENIGSVTAREVLDKASLEVSSQLKNNPDLQAEMLASIGTVYSNLGLYDRARALLEQSVTVARAAGADSDPVILRAMDDLGVVLMQQGRSAEAERWQRQALEVQQRVLGTEARDTLNTMTDLADSIEEQGRQQEAIALASQTLDIKRRVLGPEDESTLALADNLAAMYGMAGKFHESEELEAKVLEVERRTVGPDNLRFLNSLGNQGDTLFYLGRYEEARKMWTEARTAELRIVGPKHPETARSTYNLGCVAAKTGKLDEAFHYFQAAIDYLSPRTAPQLSNDPVLAPLRKDPRFAALVVRAKRYHPGGATCPL